MLLARDTNEFLLRLLKASILDEREEVGGYCSEIINMVFQPPEPVAVTWSNHFFEDSRLFHEMQKFLLTSGPLSQRTILGNAGFDVEEEREHKEEEGALVNDPKTRAQVLPIFDPKIRVTKMAVSHPVPFHSLNQTANCGPASNTNFCRRRADSRGRNIVHTPKLACLRSLLPS
jgi:hypothetical protein